jgi:four helix bundle protein
MSEPLFRFENMQIWQRAAELSGLLFKLAEKLDERRYFRFAVQLRSATLSITNNIAEGSGSVSNMDFANFLNTARRSIFEVANMLIIFTRENYLAEAETGPLGPELAEQSRMLHSFRQTLKRS